MVSIEQAPTLDLFATDLRPMQFWTAEAESKLDMWAAGKAEGVSTGFSVLDGYFRLVDGELITIAARPSMGKTIMGVQMAENMAQTLMAEEEDGCVAIFSAEMTGWSLVHRLAGARCGVNVHRLRMGGGSPQEVDTLRTSIRALRELPIWIDDGSAPTTKLMFERLARLNETIPVKAMVFDFMELGGDRAQNEELRVSQIAVALKDIAKALSIPVIALSQLSRGVESRANKMPVLSDLRYSGQIEQVSDVVAFIMRPEYYTERGIPIECPDAVTDGLAYLSIAKNRHGPVANVRMAFVKHLNKFAELDRRDLNDD